VDTDDGIGIPKPQSGGDAGAPVATLGAKALVSQVLGHQLGPQVGDLENVQPTLQGGIRETVAGHGRHHHVEGIGGVAAVATGIREQWDEFVHLEERSGPAVGDDQGHGIWALAFLVNEVNAQPIDRSCVMMEGVELLLLRSPIKATAPVSH